MQPRQRRRAQEAAQYAPRIAGQPADKKAPRLTSNCPHRQACKGSKERWHASPSRCWESVINWMNVLAFFDKFTSRSPSMNIALKAFWEFSQDRMEVDPLTFILFSSNEAEVAEAAARSFYSVRGLGWSNLSTDSLVLPAAMTVHRSGKQGYELGLEWLRRIACFGRNLDMHDNHETPEDPAKFLTSLKLNEITFLRGLETLIELFLQNGQEAAQRDLIKLKQMRVLRQWPTHGLSAPSKYEFIDPAMVALQVLRKDSSFEKAEGRVLEFLVTNKL
ncbi:hypothetical protein WJX73_005230 [Symbiochloris irregularis]|uniref:Uncharacterized protein n=1 Tax=Symbiochloris irregularis TaxID=706552 RepID=A0AAW1NTB6_9CHLO